MKRIYCTFILLFVLWPIMVGAQILNVAPAHLQCDYEVPDKLDTQVRTKLQRALTKYGISSEPGVSRFAMVPSIAIIDEHTTATVPAFCDMEFDFVISLQDAYSGIVFAAFSKTIKCRGTNKSNAIAKGVSSLRLDTPEFAHFCEDAKSKVFEYYERQIGAIAAKAKQAAVQRDFEEAVFILAEVPEECPSFNTQILPLIQQYYEREKDLFGEKVLAEARAAWAAEPNERGAAKVAEIMADMPPSCSSSAAARQFVNQISNKIEAIEKWERNYQDREQAFRHDERKATISAARAVAVAYASNQPKYITKVYLWR